MSNKRIALNTLATYGRTVVSAGFALFSSRWILAGLGEVDFGLYNLVGAVILFVVFLNSVLSTSASRHFSFSIGRGDQEETRRWFNAAFSTHLIIGMALGLLGWPIGELVLRMILNIPLERMDTALWIFRISLISATATMTAVPFQAMFTAKQRIAELALWGIVQSALTFILASRIPYLAGDRLWQYSMGMVAIVVTIQAIQAMRALQIFPECRLVPSLWFDRERFKEIASFASWSLIGSFGALLRDQGTALLLNVYFGPRVNAAYGVATQVSMQTNQLSSSMIGAFSPEITASEGRGDRQRMLALSAMASKFGTILMLFFAIPLIIEMDYILILWLKDPPQYAAEFCRMILITFLIDRTTTGIMLSVQAYGKIAAYQATVGTTLIFSLPLAWVLLKLGMSPTSIGYAFTLSMAGVTIGRVYWARRFFGLKVRQWAMEILLPSVAVSVFSFFSTKIAVSEFDPSLIRVIVSIFVAWMTIGIGVWGILLSKTEKSAIKSKFPGGLRKMPKP